MREHYTLSRGYVGVRTLQIPGTQQLTHSQATESHAPASQLSAYSPSPFYNTSEIIRCIVLI